MYPSVPPKFVENVKKSRENIALYCSVTFNRHTRHVVSPTPGKKPYFEPKEPSKFDKTDTTRLHRIAGVSHIFRHTRSTRTGRELDS